MTECHAMVSLPRLALRCSVVALALVITPGPARPCGFCYSLGGNPLALPHPKAIEIAVATRAAIDKGTLDDKCLVPASLAQGGGSGFTTLHKIPAPALVERWAARLPRQEVARQPLSIHFLFIDTEQSCALILRGGMVMFEGKPSPHSDARVVTTRTAFHALLAKKLSPPDAQRLGLLHLEGDRRGLLVLPGAAK
jgi:hypothetical protein